MINLVVERRMFTWVRTEARVDAANLEEAIAKFNANRFPDCTITNISEVSDRREPLTLSENKDRATVIIYSPDHTEELWNNKNGYNAPFFKKDKEHENASVDAP